VRENGERGIVARPSLMFGANQADELLNALSKFK